MNHNSGQTSLSQRSRKRARNCSFSHLLSRVRERLSDLSREFFESEPGFSGFGVESDEEFVR
jgi:hypothetical protein